MNRYELKSEMARVCLPRPQVHAQRNLAWTNSICLLFLVIGLAGFRPQPPPPILVKPMEEPTPVIIEPTPPPPPSADSKPEEEQRDEPQAEAPRIVVVTPDSPAVLFSVPTPGNVVVPIAQAQAPPPAPLQPATPAARKEPPPSLLGNTGEGGDRPKPDHYPPLAEQLGQQGSVVLLLTADAAGVITAVEVKETSGSPILDHFSVDFVKRHWTVAPGAPGRLFQATINYVLNSK